MAHPSVSLYARVLRASLLVMVSLPSFILFFYSPFEVRGRKEVDG